MGSRPMVVEEIRGQKTSRVPLARCQYMVQAFSPDTDRLLYVRREELDVHNRAQP